VTGLFAFLHFFFCITCIMYFVSSCSPWCYFQQIKRIKVVFRFTEIWLIATSDPWIFLISKHFIMYRGVGWISCVFPPQSTRMY
jgi:hypothetical protein